MVDVFEEKDCCGGNPDGHCGGDGPDHVCECETEVVDVRPDHWAHVQEHWDTVQENLGRAAADIRDAVTKGRDVAEPVFRDKVAPVLADASAKLAEFADTARKTTSEKAGFTDDDATSLSQITTGLAGVATGLLGLIKDLGAWGQTHATASEKEVKVEPETVVVDVPTEDVVVDDVAAVADLLQQPVYVADGDIEVVEPNE